MVHITSNSRCRVRLLWLLIHTGTPSTRPYGLLHPPAMRSKSGPAFPSAVFGTPPPKTRIVYMTVWVVFVFVQRQCLVTHDQGWKNARRYLVERGRVIIIIIITVNIS